MQVYLIRHGESEANAGGYHSGWLPVKLTARGRAQARETAALLAGVPFDRIIVSDLVRARETAEIIFPGREFTRCEAIRELDTSHLSSRKVSELREELGEVYLNARRTFDYGPLGCEPQAAFLERVRRFFHSLEALDGERVAMMKGEDELTALVTHAGVIRALGAFAMDLPIGRFALPVANGSVSVLEYAGGSWRIFRWNCGRLS